MANKKRQIIAFYRVANPLGFDRHTFDTWDDESTYKELQKLLEYTNDNFDSYVRFYSVEDLTDFQEEFNDEECDMCDGSNWWCRLLNVSE